LRRYLAVLAVALGAAACANNYDQFDFGSKQPVDGIDVWPQEEPADAKKSRDSGGDGSREASDGDEAADGRGDAPSEATVDQPDAGPDGVAPEDAGAEAGPTDDGGADDGSTGDDGSVVGEAGPIDDGGGDDERCKYYGHGTLAK